MQANGGMQGNGRLGRDAGMQAGTQGGVEWVVRLQANRRDAEKDAGSQEGCRDTGRMQRDISAPQRGFPRRFPPSSQGCLETGIEGEDGSGKPLMNKALGAQQSHLQYILYILL